MSRRMRIGALLGSGACAVIGVGGQGEPRRLRTLHPPLIPLPRVSLVAEGLLRLGLEPHPIHDIELVIGHGVVWGAVSPGLSGMRGAGAGACRAWTPPLGAIFPLRMHPAWRGSGYLRQLRGKGISS